MNIQRVGDIVTVDEFWDCECEMNYIHRKSKERVCTKCGCEEADMPDSRLNEIELLAPDLLTSEEHNELIRALFGIDS